MNDLLWRLEDILRAGLAQHKVPGASLAVYAGEALYEVAAGVLNMDTQVEATTNSLFHIASITKPMVATIAMQLVDEGRLDLDAPVRRYLPNFRVASDDVSRTVTVRHLLTHSSGIDGDFFKETTRGEDRIERLVEAASGLKQLHQLGDGFSYCNFGFTVLGRIFEVLDGIDFDSLWKRRIAEKLGAPTMVTLAEDALRYRVAVGHLPGKTGAQVTPLLFLAPSNGPAGATPMMRARDLIDFGLLHLNDGVTRSGGAVLKAESARAMREPHNRLPEGAPASHFGLAWMLFDWNGAKLYGHDGLSIGQRSYLRILPAKRMVFALLTNGGDGGGLYRELAAPLFQALANVEMPAIARPDADRKIEAQRYVGTYTKRSARIEISEAGGALMMTLIPLDDWAIKIRGTDGPYPLEPTAPDIFIWRVPGMAEPGLVHFLSPDAEGRPTVLHSGFRMHVRQG